jgi:hypothetical protein
MNSVINEIVSYIGTYMVEFICITVIFTICIAILFRLIVVGRKFMPNIFNKYLLCSIAISLAVNIVCKFSILYFFGVNVYADYLDAYSILYFLAMPVLVLSLTTLGFYGVKDFIFNFKTRFKTGLMGILISLCLGFIFRFGINSPEIMEYLKDYSPYAVGSLIASRFLVYDIFPNVLHMDRDGIAEPVPQLGSNTSATPRASVTGPSSETTFPLYSD